MPSVPRPAATPPSGGPSSISQSAVMFIGAMTLLTTALFVLLHEVRMSMGGFAHEEL